MRHLAATALAAPLLGVALLGAGTTAADALVPAPPTPWAEYHAVDTGAEAGCLVTFTWGPEADGMVDHFEYAVTDYRPDPKSNSWRDAEVQTTGTLVQLVVPEHVAIWVSVHAETYTNMPSGTSQAGTDAVSC